MRLLLLLLLMPGVMAACVDPFDGMLVEKSVTFCSGTFDIPNSITITESNVVVDCNGAILRGETSGTGVRIVDVTNVTLQNCNILTFDQGVFLKNVTHSTIRDNSILKNRIGMRLIDAYENRMEKNNDKSHQLPVSAVNSKFNVVMLGNRNLDREFCEINSCNEVRDMNICQSGDFYCSSKCTFELDDDCPAPVVETPPEEKVDPKEQVEQLIEEAKAEVRESEPVQDFDEPLPERKLPVGVKVFIYVLSYLIVFVSLRFKKR